MRAVVSGYYGFGNFGDEAILALLTDRLKKNGFEVVVLSADPRTTSMNYFVNSVNSFDFHQVSGVIKQSDLLISGGGILLQDVTSIKSLIYYHWVIFTALRYKKNVIIFAQGIGPIKNILAKFFTAMLLKKCNYISVRDAKSHDLLAKWGIQSDLLCDPIFSLNVKKSNNKGVIGVQLRGFKTLNDALLNKLARQIVKDFFDKKIKIFSFQDTFDLDVCKKFQTILQKLNPSISTQIISSGNLQNTIQEISQLEYMIAMRFHAVLLAVKMGIRTVAVNYDVKVEKLAFEAGIPLISMEADEDFDLIFENLKCLNENKLFDFAMSKYFDWHGFDEAISNKKRG